MPKLEYLVLGCSNPDIQRHFYCDVLGMSAFDNGAVGYGGNEAALLFQKREGGYVAKSTDLYWKIALAVPNIEIACHQLNDQGIEVAEPKQFRDVGYLTHFSDPQGFTVELIEHWFKGNRPPNRFDTSLFGGGAHFNLITLRTTEIESASRRCVDMGMSLLSVQPVESHGFTLYFYAFTTDSPPSPDVYAVANREWLYQRTYTVLELQHLHNETEIYGVSDTEPGYIGTMVSGIETDCRIEELAVGSITPI